MKKTTFGKEIFFIAIVFLLLTAFVNYKGNFHPFYFDAWQFYREGFGYEFDIYLKNSIVHSSIIYKLFGILKINVDDDLVGLGYQIFCNGIGFFFTYKIAQEFLDEKEKSVSLAIALSVALYYSILLHTTYSGWASNHSNTPSILAHSLMFPLVWLLIRKNWIWVGLISSFMVLTAIKVAWFPVGICIIYAFFTNGKVSHRLGWIPIPILSTLYIGRQGVQIPSNENIRNELWNNTRLIDGAESFLDLQNTWLLCFFFFSMLIFWILINQQKFKNSKLYNLSSIILFASLGLAILGGLYGRFGHLIHADPKIIMLSPVRSMALYQFFFSILVSVVIVRLKIPVITIAGLLAGTYYFSAANNLLYIMLIASFIIVWTPSKIIKQISSIFNIWEIISSIKVKNHKNAGKLILRYTFIIILPILLTQFVSKVKNLDYEGYEMIRQWDSGFRNEPDLFKSALILRKCNDFILLPLSRNQEKNINSIRISALANYDGPTHTLEFLHQIFPYYKINFVAGKSKYLGDKVNFQLNYDKYQVHLKRKTIVDQLIFEIINDNAISQNTIKNLSFDNVKVLLEENWIEKFPNNIPKHNLFGDIYLIVFGNNDEFKCIEKYKKDKIIKKI